MSILAFAGAAVKARHQTDDRARKSLGITLIEALLAIAVGAVLIIGAIAFYMSASADTQTSTANQQVQAVVSNIRALYSSQSSYTGLDNTIAVQGKVFPSTMVTGASTPATALVRNPWKGNVVVAPVTTVAAGDSFSVVYPNVPQDACIKLVSSGATVGGAVISVTVGTTAVTLPATPVAAAAACSVTNATGNTITWVAR